jgi:Raf kinase inhibitor-like YbhB/YbcL family protein
MFRHQLSLVVLAVFVAVLGIWSGVLAADANSFQLHSSAFTENEDIPAKFTCDGGNVAPPLSWSGAPAKTQSYALIVDDPDAPDPKAPKTTWVHWVMFNIPAKLVAMPEATALPPNAKDGVNDWNIKGYRGPCPPVGMHRYVFKLYALDAMLNLSNPATKAQVVAAMKGHVLAMTTLIGLYERKKN